MVGSSIHDAIAGATAGAVSKTAMAPIERVKLLMQLGGSLSADTYKSIFGIDTHIGRKHRGILMFKGARAWYVANMIYQQEGLSAFWRGNTPGVIRQGGAGALNFMLMDWYKFAMLPILKYSSALSSNQTSNEHKKRCALLTSFVSAGLAGCTTTSVLYPIDFFRTRLAMDIGALNAGTRRYPRGMRDVLWSVWKTDGTQGMYNGYGIALICVFLYRSLHLGGYDVCKTILIERRGASPNNGNAVLTFCDRIALAQIVSIVAGTVCYPLDSIRRRMMMQAGRPLHKRVYQNSFHALGKVWIDEGIRGFYLGLGPNLLRSFGGTLLLVTYDFFQVVIYGQTNKFIT